MRSGALGNGGDVVVHLDDHADRQCCAGAAAQHRGERVSVTPAGRVEHRHLQRGLGHVVAADRVERFTSAGTRQQVVDDGQPRGGDELRCVGGGDLRGALTPALGAVGGANVYEQRVLVRGSAAG